ncbi:hypothetical protein NS331_22580 [Pseudacidovorax intermedius]|uniref:Uncharacterized protein n=1 Tax=Pseudacidovorax intermedius TaxID=433924 RepID=A0A147GMN4_9BURK|nr:hypothetical protein NS331_22580 [Pseudacidovorax intermedius]
MSRATRTAADLAVMLRERFAGLPELSGSTLATQSVCVVGVEDDGDGDPTWTVRSSVPSSVWRLDVARVIKQLQLEYDLE